MPNWHVCFINLLVRTDIS